MLFWNEIINTALLGTEKKQINTSSLPPGLVETAALITEQQEADKEERFLQLAAVAYNFRQCGALSLHNEDISLPDAAAELLPYCSGQALNVLKDILSEDNPFLLAFWLQQCAAAGKLATPDLVPVLLNRAVNHKSLQVTVAAVCGKRGEWLSRFNGSWQFLADTDDDELWQTGTPEQRKKVIKRLRQVDPSKAREWLKQSWPQENANNKAELLKQLEGPVISGDNEWLTELLNEKSQKVKEEVLHLLQQLPGSTIVERYWTIVRPSVTLKKEKALLGMVNKTSLQLIPPSMATDDPIFRTGIEKLSNDKAFTDEEFVLYQLMRFIPPGYWEDHFSALPEVIIGYFQKDHAKFLPAIVNATLNFKDARWALALIQRVNIFYIDLIPQLPLQQRDFYSLLFFGKYPEPIIQYARRREGIWSHDLAKAIFKYTAKNPYQYNISFYKENIHHIPASIATELERCSPGEAHLQVMWTNISEQILKLISLKEQSTNAFNE